jgi:hypothetical protein
MSPALSDQNAMLSDAPPAAALPGASPGATAASARIVAFCSLPGSPLDPLLDWLRGRGAQLAPMPIRSLPLEWFDRYASSFDAALIDADFLGDEGAMIDFGLRLRRFAPDLPIIVISSRVAQSDYSTERMAICDVTLRAPLTATALIEALAVAVTNHDRWHEARFGRMQSR